VCVKFQWSWLHSGNFTKETESLIFAAQEQTLSTNAIRSHIYSLSCSPKCRLCNTSDKTVDHLISYCPSLVQREYKQRHDKIAGLVHWQLSRKAGFSACRDWWCHVPDKVSEND